MAKLERSIVDPGGVVVGKKVYEPGEEDELAKVILPESARQLVEKNVLSGDWSDAGTKPATKAGKSAANK